MSDSRKERRLPPITWLLLLAVIVYLATGLYYVDQNQIVLLLR